VLICFCNFKVFRVSFDCSGGDGCGDLHGEDLKVTITNHSSFGFFDKWVNHEVFRVSFNCSGGDGCGDLHGEDLKVTKTMKQLTVFGFAYGIRNIIWVA
nr:hypothetical protein [Tanacetum cinerariifolium]